MDDYDDEPGDSPLARLRNSSPESGLSAMRSMAYSGRLPKETMDLLGTDPTNPDMERNAFMSGMLKPASGGFGEALGNAFGAQSAAQQANAELKAKYLPILAQAMMQRQLQQASLMQNVWKMQQEMDQSATGALTGLLSKPGDITHGDAWHALAGVAQRGLITPDIVMQHYKQLPNSTGEIRDYIKRLTISKLDQKEGLGAVTPSVKTEDLGGQVPLVNTNANAPGGLGIVPGTTMSKSFSPTDVARSMAVEKDQAGNNWVGSKLTNDFQPLGGGAPQVPLGGNGAPLLGVAGGAPGPGAGPAAPPPSLLPPSGGPPLKTVSGLEFEKGMGKEGTEYAGDLSKSVEALQSLQQRLGEMRGLIKNFQPGASATLRLQLSSWLKDTATTLGLSPEQSNQIATSVGKGEIADQQAFQKLATQGTLDILKAANPRFTQAEFGVLSKNNPHMDLDPASFDKMQNFMTKQYQMKSSELQEFTKYMQGGNEYLGWPDKWNHLARELGYIAPTMVRGASKGSAGESSASRAGISISGRPMHWDAARNQMVYDDAGR